MIDSHAHLTDDRVFPLIDEVLYRAKQAGVSTIFNMCTSDETLLRGLTLKKRYPWVYNIAATPPHDVELDGDRLFPFMEQHAREKNLIAIGETGLDYYYHQKTRDLQKRIFRRYLALAIECNLPIVIHCREAFDDFFEIIDQDYTLNGKHMPGVLHCFTGTMSDAEKLISRGWTLSFSGIITYKKSEALREVVKATPIEQLLIETDTPYLAPQSHRKSPMNEPAFLLETASTVASIKEISINELESQIALNIQKIFHVD